MISSTRFAGRRLVCVLTLLALGGCSALDSVQGWIGRKDGVSPAKLEAFAESARFDVRWQADVGEAGASLLQPALTDAAVYGAAASGTLTRVERTGGKTMWRVDSGIRVTGGVGVGEGLVLIGGDKGDVLAYGEDGKLRWKGKVSSEVLSVPRIFDGVVVVRSSDGRITGLDATDGKRIWRYERNTPALVVRSHAGVTIQRGVAYAGFAGGKLVALKVKDGATLWEAAVSQPRGNTELERISDITSDPVADDEQVCAVAFQGRLACFEIAQGAPLWNRDISSDKGLALLRKHLYVTDVEGNVIALDKSTGSTLWKNEQLTHRDTATPYAQGDFVLVGDFEGYLHALSREDGRFIGRVKLSGALQAPIQPFADGLLAQTHDGNLYSLSLK